MVRRRVDYTKMHLISQSMYEKLKKCLEDDKPKPKPDEYISEIVDPTPGPSNVTITRQGVSENFDIGEDEDIDEPVQQPLPPQQDTSSFFETQEIPELEERIPPKRGIKTTDIRKIKSIKHRKKFNIATPVRRNLVIRRPLPSIPENLEVTQFITQPEHDISSGSDVETPPRPVLSSTPRPHQRSLNISGINPIDEPMEVIESDDPVQEVHAVVPFRGSMRPVPRRRPIQIEEIGSESFHMPDISSIRSIQTNLPPIQRSLPAPPRLLPIAAPPRVLAIQSPPQQAALEGPQQILPISGPPQRLAIEGPRQISVTVPAQTRSQFRQLPLTSCDQNRPIVKVTHSEGEEQIVNLPKEKFRLGKFICSICGQEFSSKYALRRHISNKHASQPFSRIDKFPRPPRDPSPPPPPPPANPTSQSGQFESWIKPQKRKSDEAKLKQHQKTKYRTNPSNTKKRFDSWNL